MSGLDVFGRVSPALSERMAAAMVLQSGYITDNTAYSLLANVDPELEKVRAEDKAREFAEAVMYPARYFDPTAADDLGDGSRGRPYKNLTAARVSPGVRHLIKAGTTITCGATSPWLLVPAGGGERAPIVFGRYGDHRAANPVIDGSATALVVRINSGAKHVRLRDVEIVGGQTGATTRMAISVVTADAAAEQDVSRHLVITRVTVRDVTSDSASDCNGIKLYGADNLVLDCDIRDIATDGIWFHGFRTQVAGCSIYRVAKDGRGAGDCIQAGAKSDGSIIRGNYLDHSDVAIKQCVYFEATVSVSSGVLIEDNVCLMAADQVGASPITCGATNSIVRRNRCVGGYVGIFCGEATRAHNNFILSLTGRGIELKAGAVADHNTVVQTGSDTSQNWSVGIRAQADAPGAVAYNNLLIGQYNGCTTQTVVATGAPALTEYSNAFATRGVSLAHVRVDGVVVPATKPVVLVDNTNYASAAALIGYDQNYRPAEDSVLTGLSGSFRERDCDQKRTDSDYAGAFS